MEGGKWKMLKRRVQTQDFIHLRIDNRHLPKAMTMKNSHT
jgi:hypothetical protein